MTMHWLIAPPWRSWAQRVSRPFAGRSPWTFATFRKRRRGRAARIRLQALDARTLQDLGIHPGEIPFLAARVGEGRILGGGERRSQPTL